MKFLILWHIFLVTILVPTYELEVSALRQLYYQAAENKEASIQLNKLLIPINNNSSPIFVCYKGAAHMMEAKYAFNPLSKLSKFNKGKKLIEAAIQRDPNQMEMRFLRFSIQTNLPSFLGYDQWIEADKQLLLNQVSKVKDEDLKGKIIRYLYTSKYCTKEEVKKLKI